MNKNRLMTGVILAILMITGTAFCSDAPKMGQKRHSARFCRGAKGRVLVDPEAIAKAEECRLKEEERLLEEEKILLKEISAGVSDEAAEKTLLERLLAIVRSTYEANAISFVVAYMDQSKEDRDTLRQCLVGWLPSKFRRRGGSQAFSNPAGSPHKRSRRDLMDSVRIDKGVMHALRSGELAWFAEKIRLLELGLVITDMYEPEGLFALWAYMKMDSDERLVSRGDFLAALDKHRKATP